MRQKTRRTALGMFLSGFSASPAAMATISTPPYEKLAWTSVEKKARKRPRAPPTVTGYCLMATSFQ
jgi:hypothetical protein